VRLRARIGGIEQANISLCMQVNASAGYVDEAKTYSDGDFNYESRWNTNDCLTYNQSGGDLDVHGCADVNYEDIVLLSNPEMPGQGPKASVLSR
jgi:hypothetical protein